MSSTRSKLCFYFVYFFLLLMLFSTSTCQAKSEHVSKDFKCASYKPKRPPKGACLARLEKHPEEFESCRSGKKVCFLFINETPLNVITPAKDSFDPIDFQKPFECGRFRDSFGKKASVSGLVFRLQNKTSSANDLCAWVGESCTFHMLVDYLAVMTKEGYRFAISGLLLETLKRQCHHESSVAIVSDQLSIIGNRPDSVTARSSIILFKPFHWGAWAIFTTMFLLFVVVCFIITWHLQAYRKRSFGQAILILLGSADESTVEMDPVWNDGFMMRRGVYPLRNGVVISLFRVAIGATILIFILFYEVAVVNFLFQASPAELSTKVERLTVEELKDYGILANSAMESIWISAVDPHEQKVDSDNPKKYPWRRCATGVECLDLLKKGKIKFMVSYGIEIDLFLSEKSNCEKYTRFETRDTLYEFSGGWLYNEAVSAEYRQEVNRGLLELRIHGKVDEIIQDETDMKKCVAQPIPTIDVITILIPCVVLVFPPLVASLCVLFCSQRQSREQKSCAAVGDSESTSNNSTV